jgi:6-phosphogluconolactonase
MDKMIGRIEILPDPLALAHHVAEWITQAALAAPGPFRVSLSGGSTPKTLYGLLASDEFRSRFPCHAFPGTGVTSALSRTIIPTAIIG